MKYYLKHIIFLFLLLMLGSCNNSEIKPSHKTSEQNQFSELQKYTIDTSEISILWTDYKFTNKVAVSGTFDMRTFETKNSSSTVENILKKSKSSISTATVNSGNFKLDTYFFKGFSTLEIKGAITKAKENKPYFQKNEFTYSIEKETIRLFTNLNYWKAEEALNTECYELHKGTDGISKIWPNVDVVIKIPARKVLIIN